MSPLLVFGVTAAVFAPAIGYGLIWQWDDSSMFILNPMLRAWSWQWMATTFYLGHWMPLSWLLATVNFHVFGLAPAGWHAVNVGLHAINAVLVYLIARRLVGSTLGAVVAALLFSVHPLRIESVAWVTEQRDVLMGACYLGAVLLWLRGRRVWAFAAFVLACLSKSLAVSLPVMLLLLEWYRHRDCCRGRLPTWLAWRLAPFVAVSLVVSAIAFRALFTLGNTMAWSIIPLGTRLLHVAYSEVFYAWQTLWPSRLSHLIEYTWAPSWDQLQYPLAVAVLVIVAVVLFATRRRWPACTAAAVAYAVAIFPQAGLFQNGPQLVANRYSYLACLPFALLAGGAITALAARSRPDGAAPHVYQWPRAAVALSVAVVGTLVLTTSTALPMWRNSDTLWEYAATHEPTCNWCLDMAGVMAYRRGDLDTTRRYLVQAIAVSDTTALPRWERHWSLAAILVQMGRRDEAMTELRTYLAVIPANRYETVADRGHIDSARRTLAQLELKGAL